MRIDVFDGRTVKKILRWALWIPIGAILVLFLVANRRLVSLSLDPFSTTDPAFATFPLPLWLWLALFFFIGIGLGGFGMWLSGRELRLRAKADRLELKAMKKTQESEMVQSPPPPPPTLEMSDR